MNLEPLSDIDLEGLTSFCEPLARMDAPEVSRWGKLAWHACRDERSRRAGGASVSPKWPSYEPLSNEELVLLSGLLRGIHDQSPELARFVEQTGEDLVDVLAGRAWTPPGAS